MYGFEYPKHMPVGRVCLEVSLKPFGLDLSDEGIRKTCREMLDGWRELILHADGVSVLMWLSDGSEILEYNGDLNSEFDWARYIGIGNPKKELPPWDPEGKDLHSRPVLYMDNPPKMTYADLKRVVALLKETAKEVLQMEIEVGETFDPGPEFAYSDFKFHRHPELSKGTIVPGMWIHCAGSLHADHYRYAAYPDGIPEGTPFGTFLGKQFMAFKKDTGFDYIWLSNGFGFSLESWNWKGEVFDGKKFDLENADAVRESIRQFWETFTAETGDMRIETRGSNLSAGMDISAHGCPVDAIYRYPMVAPPNSPWAALDFRFGLELCGYLSRIAELPEKGYLFRYYTHDPWWYNSPWFDRYDRSPHDIYLPLTEARMDAQGKVTPPAGISFLSVDDSFGRLPRRCPAEVTPHLLDAYSHYPDAPGPVVWVYPFLDYCECGKTKRMQQIFMDDWLIENALDQGLPLNTIVSDGNFVKADLAPYAASVLVMPVPLAGGMLEKALERALEAGNSVLLYGNPALASEKVRRWIGVEETEAIEGEFDIETDLVKDSLRMGKLPSRLRHCALISDGGLSEKGTLGQTQALAWVRQGDKKRLYAALNSQAGKGKIAWLRGSFPHDEQSGGALPFQLDSEKYFPAARLMRSLLECFGWKIETESEDVHTLLPILHMSVNRNTLYFTGFAKDTTTEMRISTPQGAPLFPDRECIVEDDTARFAPSRWWHSACHFLVRQKERSVVSVLRRPAHHPDLDELFEVSGLRDATLTIRIPVGARLRLVSTKTPHIVTAPDVPFTIQDGTARAEHLNGSYFVAWQADDNPASMVGENQLHLKKVMEARR